MEKFQIPDREGDVGTFDVGSDQEVLQKFEGFKGIQTAFSTRKERKLITKKIKVLGDAYKICVGKGLPSPKDELAIALKDKIIELTNFL